MYAAQGHIQPGVSIVGNVNRKALFFQHSRHEPSEPLVIFNYEHSHRNLRPFVASPNSFRGIEKHPRGVYNREQ
jgi:hypothetical protein